MSFCKCSFGPAKKYVKEQIPVITKKEAEAREAVMFIGGLAVGVAVGTVIGAGIAALTVPHSGEETRQNIRDTKDYTVSNVKESSAKVTEKVKETAGTVVDKIKDKISSLDEEDVVVEYTIHYDDEDAATAEPCCDEVAEGCCEEAEEAAECCEEGEEACCCEEAAEEPAEDAE